MIYDDDADDYDDDDDGDDGDAAAADDDDDGFLGSNGSYCSNDFYGRNCHYSAHGPNASCALNGSYDSYSPMASMEPEGFAAPMVSGSWAHSESQISE